MFVYCKYCNTYSNFDYNNYYYACAILFSEPSKAKERCPGWCFSSKAGQAWCDLLVLLILSQTVMHIILQHFGLGQAVLRPFIVKLIYNGDCFKCSKCYYSVSLFGKKMKVPNKKVLLQDHGSTGPWRNNDPAIILIADCFKSYYYSVWFLHTCCLT